MLCVAICQVPTREIEEGTQANERREVAVSSEWGASKLAESIGPKTERVHMQANAEWEAKRKPSFPCDLAI